MLPDDIEATKTALREAKEKRESVSVEYRLRDSEGVFRWVTECFEPHRDDKGEWVGFVGALSDIDARKKKEITRKLKEETLRRTSDSLAELVERCPLGIYTVDSNFKVANVSEGAKPAFRNVWPVVGRDFAEVVDTLWGAEFGNEVVPVFRHTLATGEAYVSPGLVEMHRDIGAIESYEWQVTRITLADGRYGVVCYYFDVTRLQQANQELRDTRSRLDSTLSAGEVGTWEFDVAKDSLRIDVERSGHLFGVSSEQASGGTLEDYLIPVHHSR